MDSEQEISLYDIVKVFRNHKKLFYLVFFVLFVISSVIIFLIPRDYSFVQSIRIASYENPDGVRVPLLSADVFRAKLATIYMPKEINKARELNPDSLLDIKMLRIKNIGADGIFLYATGPKKSQQEYTVFFKAIVKDLTDYLDSEVQFQKQYLTNLLDSLQKQYAMQKTYQQQNEQLKLKKILLMKKINELPTNMADNIFQQNAIFNDQKLFNLAQEILVAKCRLETLQNMRIDSEVVAIRVLNKQSKRSQIILFAFAAFFIAIIAVFVKEFIDKVKRT